MYWSSNSDKRKIYRKIGLLLILTAYLICLTGCKDKQPGDKGTDAKDEAIGLYTEVVCPWDGFSALMADGAYFWNDSALNYADWKTGETYMMCYDPTCDHKWRKEGAGWDYSWVTKCTALLHGRNIKGSRMVGDTFFSIRGKTDDFEKIEIWCSKLDQADETLFATLDAQDSIRASCWYKNELLFLAYWNLYAGESDESGATEMEACIPGIYEISLKDGKVTKLVEKSSEGKHSVIQDMICNGQKLWYSYGFVGEEKTQNTQIWCYDLTSGKETMVREFSGDLLHMDAERFLFSTYDRDSDGRANNYRLYVSSWDGDPELIHEMAQWYTGLLCGDKVLFSENRGATTSIHCYELATKTTKRLLADVNLQLDLEAVFPQVVYCSGQGAAMNYSMLYIPMQDLLAGNSDAIKKLYEYNAGNDQYYEQ